VPTRPKVSTMTPKPFDALKGMAIDGWGELSRESINHWIESMPKRLQKFIRVGNGLVGASIYK